jgi:hypothetical protein
MNRFAENTTHLNRAYLGLNFSSHNNTSGIQKRIEMDPANLTAYRAKPIQQASDNIYVSVVGMNDFTRMSLEHGGWSQWMQQGFESLRFLLNLKNCLLPAGDELGGCWKRFGEGENTWLTSKGLQIGRHSRRVQRPFRQISGILTRTISAPERLIAFCLAEKDS